MAKVVNLNRFRKKKAKEAKERRAEQNRRLHGRTKAERQAEEYQKRRLDKQLEGALLVPERVDLDALVEKEPAEVLETLDALADKVVSLSEFSARLKTDGTSETPSEDDSQT